MVIIAKSIGSHPYIISNTNMNIYGFQFHPEICLETILYIQNLFFSNNNIKFTNFPKLDEINEHFFGVFINN